MVYLVARQRRRRIQYQHDNPTPQTVTPLPPIVVVGNMSVGGTGKTPLILALSTRLRQQGYNVGIISRGYGAQPPHLPFEVSPNTNALYSGDEPKMLAQLSGCPVVIDPERINAAQAICANHTLDFLLSDDGLQHIGLPRSLEILVCDGKRQFGNGLCLPAGPLREPLSRLNSIDFIVQTGQAFNLPINVDAPIATQQLKPIHWVNVLSGETRPLNPFPDDRPITAVTGIGNPDRFFSSLTALDLRFKPVSYPDHYRFQSEDFTDFVDNIVVMTAKDAVKCQAFAKHHWWYLQVEACLPETWYQQFLDRLAALHGG